MKKRKEKIMKKHKVPESMQTGIESEKVGADCGIKNPFVCSDVFFCF